MEFKVGQKVEVVEVKRSAVVKVGDVGEILSILEAPEEEKEMSNFDLIVSFNGDIWLFGEDELKVYECKCGVHTCNEDTKEFKIGAKVRCIKSECGCISELGLDGIYGEVGEIVDGMKHSWKVTFNTENVLALEDGTFMPLKYTSWVLCEQDLELI